MPMMLIMFQIHTQCPYFSWFRIHKSIPTHAPMDMGSNISSPFQSKSHWYVIFIVGYKGLASDSLSAEVSGGVHRDGSLSGWQAVPWYQCLYPHDIFLQKIEFLFEGIKCLFIELSLSLSFLFRRPQHAECHQRRDDATHPQHTIPYTMHSQQEREKERREREKNGENGIWKK